MMLARILLCPILIGIVFRFLIPFAEWKLCAWLKVPSVLAPYYLLFDLLLVIMTPIMSAFCAVMVILEEIDTGISGCLIVTPLGKTGYLLSRIGLPTVFAVLYNILILLVFSLTRPSAAMILLLSLLGGLMGVITALLVISLASNKVEGMALAKLSGFLALGLPVPFFISGSIQYWASPLPSLWLAKLAVTGNYIYIAPSVIVSLLWIGVLLRIFERKLMK